MKTLSKKTILAGLLAVAALAPVEIGAFSFSFVPQCIKDFGDGFIKNWSDFYAISCACCLTTCPWKKPHGQCQNTLPYFEREDHSGKTVLHHAAEDGDLKEVKNLVKKGAKVNGKMGDMVLGFTPLQLAVMGGKQAVVKYLVEIDKANIDAKNHSGGTALFHAALHGQKDLVKQLVTSGADVNSKQTLYGLTPLLVAAEYGHFNVVEYLVKHKANILEKDKYGNTALHKAAARNHYEIIKLLVENSPKAETEALIKAHGEFGKTVLHYIVESGQKGKAVVEIVKFLIKVGADVNARNRDHKQPVAYIQNIKDEDTRIAVLDLLLEKDDYFKTPEDKQSFASIFRNHKIPGDSLCINGCWFDVTKYGIKPHVNKLIKQ